MKNRISFVGAGPGDPELLTIKAMERIKEADMIIHAGSLVNPEILKYAKEDAEIYDSKDMVLEDIAGLMIKGFRAGKKVVRLQTGDLSLYSSLAEQITPLEAEGIDIEIIPGISSFQAASASLKKEYTVPGGTQTLILSRITGKTPVPQKEAVKKLAEHGSSLVFFLSMARLEELVGRLQEVLPPETQVAVCYRVSWPQEKKITGQLSSIIDKVEKSNIEKKTALILVGDFLNTVDSKSKLYDKNFSHEYRKGSD